MPRCSKELDRFFLIMIEQPLGWDDIYAIRLLQELDTPICLDECIHSGACPGRNRTEACKIINMKFGRVGGHTAQRIHELCQAQ